MFLYFKLYDGYKDPKKAAVLRKTIYSLKQFVYQWNKNLSTKFFRTSLIQLISDYSIFIRNAKTTKVVMVFVYIDKFLIFGLNKAEIDNVKL